MAAILAEASSVKEEYSSLKNFTKLNKVVSDGGRLRLYECADRPRANLPDQSDFLPLCCMG